MSKIEIVQHHTLGREEARRRADDALAVLGNQYKVKGYWHGDAFVVTEPATGTFVVDDDRVVVDLTLGWLLSMMADEIRAKIDETLHAYLA